MECLNEKCFEKNGSVELELTESDDRVEWYRESYECPKCHSLHERLTTYQPQSRIVASDEFYILDKNGNRIGPLKSRCLPSGEEDEEEKSIFILTREDVILTAREMGIPEEKITDDVLYHIKKGVEFGLECWSDIMKVAIDEAIRMEGNK